MHRVLERQLRRSGITDGPPDATQWRALLARIEQAYVEADQDRYTLERSLDLSSTEMRKRFAELRTTQQQLVETSRKAGMADVATSVLHNIGNVLNSVNMSSHTLREVVKRSARPRLKKTLELVVAQPEPGKFLDEDARGKKVLPYLVAIEQALAEGEGTTLSELDALTKSIEHIRAVVTRQLDLARGTQRSATEEGVKLDELAQSATAMLDGRAGVRVLLECDGASIRTDRHKVLGILGNLLANARDAITARGDGVVTLRARSTIDGCVIDVVDDGIGMAPETLARIFNHGFTTKPTGHGFGLHASACAAIELGGTLAAKSDGLGRGATFTLTLPSSSLLRKAA